ncbi:MAG: RagB/SusD family nutrient uptake outer membrane protein [Prevotellaceae bacterium]|jgi:hypothetical protein|nr:RagB/SusD family nutrient uptake outer membrane protein [Prevotellaceae bacterium]
MKNTAIKAAVYAALLTLMSACAEDFLEAPTKSSMDESVIFSTPAYAERAIPGVLQSFAETNSYRGRYLPYYGMNTDVEVQTGLGASVSDATGSKERLVNYDTDLSNEQMNTDNNAWAKFYEGIERANLAIRGLRAYGDVESNAELAQILGEVITLRAIVYSDLLKGWGNVPARFEPISSETAYLPRVDRDVALKQLLADLEEAATLVGWPNENRFTTSTEHVNKCFVKGMRARIALMAGGYSLHMGETTLRLSTDPDLEKTKMYQIAKQECLDVINSGHARLQPGGFEAAFKAVHAETYVAGNEGFWELPFSDGRGRVIFDLGVQHEHVDKYTGQAKGGTNGPNPIMFYKYEKEDVRRDVSCIPYKWYEGRQVLNTSFNRWFFGKYRYEWLNRRVTSTNDDGLNYLYMRYAEVLLMAAEAINELEGPGAAAPYLRQIRERAYPNHPEKVAAHMSAATASKEAFFSAIVDERALEFCGEMLRKADLIRWNLLTEKMNENKADLEKLHNRSAPYSDVPQQVYWKNAPDGETIILYGMERGENSAQTDPSFTFSAITSTSGGTTTTLVPASPAERKLHGDNDQRPYWERIFVHDPSAQPYWPIWRYFIDNSNGTLDNDPVFNS